MVSAKLETIYEHCPFCGREVATLSQALVTKILDLQEQTIDELAAAGRLHTIQVANRMHLVCCDSLFGT